MTKACTECGVSLSQEALFCGYCGTKIVETLVNTSSQSDDRDLSDIVECNNTFAFNLYSVLKRSDENLFFSPYSISCVGGMLCEGADGETLREILEVFGLPENSTERKQQFRKLHHHLNDPGQLFTLHTGNALWAQQAYPFLPEYLKDIQQYYRGEARNVDFMANVEHVRHTINEWVAQQTFQKIRELFAPGTLDASTRLVLTNAIYFKGNWHRPFPQEKTCKEPFYVTPTTSIQVSMMKHDEARFRYMENSQLQALELPYQGFALSMIILLPRVHDLRSLEESLDAHKIDTIRKRMSSRKVNVWLPVFELESGFILNETLQQLGMRQAFGMQAQFPRMVTANNLYVSKIIHKAYVKTDEQGTEAAAATGADVVIMGLMMPEPIHEFKADHPFLFMIVDNAHGTVLFMGRINDPS